MPDARTIRDQVAARVAELEAIIQPLQTEYEQLKSIAAGFGGSPAARAPRRASRAAPASQSAAAAQPSSGEGEGGGGGGGGALAGGGSRAQQAVRLIAVQPGITAAGLAQAMGISRNYLYRVLPRLEKAGTVVKQGSGYHPASSAGNG